MDEKTVLVIEDEEDIQQLVAFNLMKEGFRVRCAESGEEGLRLAESVQPALVLLDIMLPGIDGLAVLSRLKEEPEAGSHPGHHDERQGRGTGYRQGPQSRCRRLRAEALQPKVLLARIRSVLRRHNEAAPKEPPPSPKSSPFTE